MGSPQVEQKAKNENKNNWYEIDDIDRHTLKKDPTEDKEKDESKNLANEVTTIRQEGKPAPSDEEDCVKKTVTVVEHEHGFMSKVLNIKQSQPSSVSSKREEEPILSSTEKGSFKLTSEKSKPLSPMTSQRMSPQDQAFNYSPNYSSNKMNSSRSKNMVKFKDEDGSNKNSAKSSKDYSRHSKTHDQHENNSGSGIKNSSTKITSILKNSSKDRPPIDKTEAELEGDKFEKGNSEDKHSTDGEEKSKQILKSRSHKDKIPNMKVEEDQVNLSDLGNGPDKPTIKTIVKKYLSHNESQDIEPTPSSIKSLPGSRKSISSKKSLTKTNMLNEHIKEEKIEEDSESEGDSEYSQEVDGSALLDYDMKSEQFDFEQLTHNPHFKIKKFKDAIYRGCIHPESGLRQGLGVMEYDNGRVYEGTWEEDLRNGKGFERYANGNRYEGDFEAGKAHGKGFYKWANGEYYDGEWKNGQKDGYGEWWSHEGETYVGEWKEGKASGKGWYTWSNGDKYDGEWLQCLKHGKGQDQFSNGDSYTGQYRYGKPWGIGIYQWKNGSLYEGQFKNGLKHGKGKWMKGKGEDMCTFEGNYVKGKKEGYGEFKWASGNFYRGEYKDDERDGYGEMYWVDGSWYKGAWVKGIQHGQGIMQLPDGTIKRGMFENNIFIEEIAEEDEILESSIIDNELNLGSSKVMHSKFSKKKKK
jgi:hypothetical protein